MEQIATNTATQNSGFVRQAMVRIGIFFGLVIIATITQASMEVSVVFGPLVMGIVIVFVTSKVYSREKHQFVLKQLAIYIASAFGFISHKEFAFSDEYYLIVLTLLTALFLLSSIFIYLKRY